MRLCRVHGGLLALLTALILGALHALSPGHGKTIVGAYLVGSKSTAKHALFLGFTVTVTHTLGVFALGFVTLFASRFIIQWFKSELVGRSVIPLSFWYCSLSGGVVLLAYALYKMDPVFITGQATGLLVYSRNLYLIFREKRNAHPKLEIEIPQR